MYNPTFCVLNHFQFLFKILQISKGTLRSTFGNCQIEDGTSLSSRSALSALRERKKMTESRNGGICMRSMCSMPTLRARPAPLSQQHSLKAFHGFVRVRANRFVFMFDRVKNVQLHRAMEDACPQNATSCRSLHKD